MGIYDQFETDREAEADGKWFEFPANRDGSIPRVKLARMARTNPRYVKALEHYQKIYKVELANDLMDNEKSEGPFLDVFCDTVLLEWENVQNRAGEAIPFEKRKEVMLKLPAFYDVLRTYAAEVSSFKAKENKEAAGE